MYHFYTNTDVVRGSSWYTMGDVADSDDCDNNDDM